MSFPEELLSAADAVKRHAVASADPLEKMRLMALYNVLKAESLTQRQPRLERTRKTLAELRVVVSSY